MYVGRRIKEGFQRGLDKLRFGRTKGTAEDDSPRSASSVAKSSYKRLDERKIANLSGAQLLLEKQPMPYEQWAASISGYEEMKLQDLPEAPLATSHHPNGRFIKRLSDLEKKLKDLCKQGETYGELAKEDLEKLKLELDAVGSLHEHWKTSYKPSDRLPSLTIWHAIQLRREGNSFRTIDLAASSLPRQNSLLEKLTEYDQKKNEPSEIREGEYSPQEQEAPIQDRLEELKERLEELQQEVSDVYPRSVFKPRDEQRDDTKGFRWNPSVASPEKDLANLEASIDSELAAIDDVLQGLADETIAADDLKGRGLAEAIDTRRLAKMNRQAAQDQRSPFHGIILDGL